ncbi:MAG TPA: methyltransferase domain-containing protein [Solirubrobacteraceae bacterium]|jgi:SAM-dependent methyltransferase|nr:methyltransferase domain-containing protein [Solirubrobacteraceae bacterium]
MSPAELAAILAHDDSHWWYRGRRRVIRAALDGLQLPAACAILDVGCGSGRMLDELRGYGIASGLDVSPLAVAAAQARGHVVHLGEAAALPFDDASFDLLTCFDVLEHTLDDRGTLRELARVCRPGGTLLVTVPAYESLWSRHDDANHHRRRYTASRLRTAAAEAGLAVELDTYFNSLLLAPAALVLKLQRLRGATSERSNLELTPAYLNGVLELPMRLEARALRAGMRMPAGLSLLAVLRRGA